MQLTENIVKTYKHAVNFLITVNQRFLFFLELLLGFISETDSECEASNLTPTAELHRALSTSDGVKVSPSELNSCTSREHQILKKTDTVYKTGEHSNFEVLHWQNL